MKIVKAANRYAKSLLELAVEQGQIEQVYEDMQKVSETVSASRDLQVMLNSPIIKPDQKARVLAEVFGGKIGEMAFKFINLITDKGREGLLGGIAGAYIIQYKAFKNVSQAEVISAAPLSEESKKKIEEMLQKLAPGMAELKETIDPNVIGGYILKVGDQMLDASVSSQLRELRREFTENLYVPGF